MDKTLIDEIAEFIKCENCIYGTWPQQMPNRSKETIGGGVMRDLNNLANELIDLMPCRSGEKCSGLKTCESCKDEHFEIYRRLKQAWHMGFETHEAGEPCTGWVKP